MPNSFLFVILIVVLPLLSSCKKEDTPTNSTTTTGQWVQTSFSTSGSITAIAANSAAVFVSTSTEGMAKSTDTGVNWTQVTGEPTVNDIPLSLIMHGSNLFVGTLFNIFMSSDYGQSWEARRTGIPGFSLSAGLFLLDGTNLFVATGSGVYVSTNLGASWTIANDGLRGNLTAFAVNGSNLFASSDSGVFRSTNSGTTWTRTNLTSRSYSIAALGANVFAAIRDAPGGVLRSTDNGENWVPVNNGLLNANAAHTLFVHGNTVYAGTVRGVYYTRDNGASWVAFNDGFTSQTTNISEFALGGTTMYVGLQGGIGAVWKRSL